jgi:hypothetical protein
MRTFLLAAAAALTPALVVAQVTTVDAGSFTITRDGAAAGREEFVIRSTPGPTGRQYVASATVTIADRRLAPALNTDSSGAPVKYQVETRAGGDDRELLSGQVGRGRFSARVQSARGESAKEYIVANGALILDDDVFHQYFFLSRRAPVGPVPVVVPRRSTQLTMRVEPLGGERVTVGGRALEARRFRLTEPGGTVRELWTDDAGRVLRVEIPSRGVVAVRDDPPA